MSVLDLAPKKGKLKWVVMAKFKLDPSHDNFCHECYEAFSKFAEEQDIDITPNNEGWFYAPVGSLEVSCKHGKSDLLKSAYV